MKSRLIFLLQSLLGYKNYLFLFSLSKIRLVKFLNQEKEFLKFLELVGEEDNVLDIGANIGVMSVFLSGKAKRGRVFAFEPEPTNLSILKKVIRTSNRRNVQVFPVALGEQEKTITMVLPVRENIKKHGLSRVVHGNVNKDIPGYNFEVSQKKLDDIEELKDIKINAIKIDVENYEYFVFSGGKNLLIRNMPVIFCELWKNAVREKVFEFLTGLGYKIKVLYKGKLVDFDETRHTNDNFIFIP